MKNLLQQKISLIIKTTVNTDSPTDFQFRLQSRMRGGPTGEVLQTIGLFNYNTNEFERLDARDAQANTDGTVLIVPAGDLSRFVKNGSNEIKASMTWQNKSFSGPQFRWSVDVDEAVWFAQ